MQNSENNKRIAKNTGMLYIRMLLTMAVTLYTSRIVLNTLGVEDFGIYNVVGGFVAMLGFLNNSMAVATQRFLSFEIGRKDSSQLAKVFSMSVNIHFIIALIILLLAETVGLWFVNTQLTIPPERMEAVQWVYQFSIFAFLVNVLSVPYNAIIIAHERMKIFAMVSIIDVSLKLFVVFVLQWFGFDKLEFYAVLMFSVALIVRIIYGFYCSRNFAESKYRFFWDNLLFKTIMSFSAWSLWGSLSSVLASQGVNILLNIFFGPAVNAARGIAYQVKGAVTNFALNIQIAINPQIIKSFASDNLKYMHQLIFQGTKYSFFLLLAISMPILLETDIILKLWLNIVPEYTIIFSKLIIINALIESLSGSFITAVQATGKIKVYQGVIGGLFLLILPISYLFLILGFPPQVTLFVNISISIIVFTTRLIFVKYLLHINIKEFLLKVVLNVIIVSCLAFILPLVVHNIIEKSFIRFITVVCVSILSTGGFIYLIGFNKQERLYFLKIIHKKNKFKFK